MGKGNPYIPAEPIIPETITIIETYSSSSVTESFSYARYDALEHILVCVPEINGTLFKEDEPFGHSYFVDVQGSQQILDTVMNLQRGKKYLYEKEGSRVTTHVGKRCMGTLTIIELKKGNDGRFFYQCGDLEESPITILRNMLVKNNSDIINSSCKLDKNFLSSHNRNVVNIALEVLATINCWPSNEQFRDNAVLLEQSQQTILRLARWYYENARPPGNMGWYEDPEQVKKQETAE